MDGLSATLKPNISKVQRKTEQALTCLRTHSKILVSEWRKEYDEL